MNQHKGTRHRGLTTSKAAHFDSKINRRSHAKTLSRDQAKKVRSVRFGKDTMAVRHPTADTTRQVEEAVLVIGIHEDA